ncbi:tigger transposable element-derived protein 4-like [Rhipicephalus sanguineus]|uniref:tigger transposable element-derived protein 4-like n=1 Tax=Rhipicephalus sanguineus TaxID=34632 RepID=UPI0020C21FD0|nr:tigger transposable element-derived protein 4-like [Rhipicephalus sanguineus]
MAPTVPSQPTAKAGPTTSKRGKYTTLTMAKKAAIIQQVQSGRPQVEVAREFNVSKQTVSDYMKNKDKILGASEKSRGNEQKRVREGCHPQLEEALSIWLNATVAQRVPVSGHLLKQKAETLALRLGIDGFKFSDGWLRNFKKRYDLAFKKMCGESGAVDNTLVTNYRGEKLVELLRRYSADDTFNLDETGLFYKLLPEKTLARSGEPCHGGKLSKERITVVVGSNASGSEKLPLLVIGKSKNPRCFKGKKNLPVWYEANTKAWVTQKLFEEYVRKLDRKLELQKRKVLLFVDNCTAHAPISSLKAIELEYLPPNTTSVLQPMDQGIIKNLKVHYRSRLLQRVLLCLESQMKYKVDLMSAVSMIADAWKAVSADTISNSFRHAGFTFRDESGTAIEEPDLLPSATSFDADIIDDLRSCGMPIPDTVNFEDFANVDSAVSSCAELNDDEIIDQVVQSSNSDSDTDDDDAPPRAPEPSHAELSRAFAVLSSSYSDHATLAEIGADLVVRKRKCVQQRIDNFFHPQGH